MLTAYDYSLAKLVDAGGVDVILVGDSASNVMAGQVTTVPITLDHMIYHAQCVQRAVDRALIVVDLPFGSYQGNSKQALDSSIRIMKEAEAHAVKLEGGSEVVESIRRILTAGIPVMGHLGLTPQSIYKFGTYTVRAKEDEEAEKLLADARLLEEAGCFALVLEKIHGNSRPAWPKNCPSPSSASVQAQTSTARSSCSTTCSASRWTFTPLPAPLPEPRGVHRRSHHLLLRRRALQGFPERRGIYSSEHAPSEPHGHGGRRPSCLAPLRDAPRTGVDGGDEPDVPRGEFEDQPEGR